MSIRLKRIFFLLGILGGISVIANVVLIFWVIHVHHELRNNYIVSMRRVESNLTLADASLNQHQNVSGTPEYLISSASGILSLALPPYGGYDQTVAIAFGTTDYIITHPQSVTPTQYSSAKQFVHSSAQLLRNSIPADGSVNVAEAQSAIKQIAQDIPSAVKSFK